MFPLTHLELESVAVVRIIRNTAATNSDEMMGTRWAQDGHNVMMGTWVGTGVGTGMGSNLLRVALVN